MDQHGKARVSRSPTIDQPPNVHSLSANRLPGRGVIHGALPPGPRYKHAVRMGKQRRTAAAQLSHSYMHPPTAAVVAQPALAGCASGLRVGPLAVAILYCSTILQSAQSASRLSHAVAVACGS